MVTDARLNEILMSLIHRIVDIRDSSYPAFSPIVLTPEEIRQRLEIDDQFIQEILTRGEVLYAQQYCGVG